eukprot:TRINITY_DN41295_c0_g1_i1.p1 TRINITY_DN41295_c0_g1~~TRINITY_DN41295_c0_g1_i1.p1  ORF type:complete len:227 (-),score=34.13 TRINITY_DN41295_c0_g1_i1:50-730(-)
MGVLCYTSARSESMILLPPAWPERMVILGSIGMMLAIRSGQRSFAHLLHHTFTGFMPFLLGISSLAEEQGLLFAGASSAICSGEFLVLVFIFAEHPSHSTGIEDHGHKLLMCPLIVAASGAARMSMKPFVQRYRTLVCYSIIIHGLVLLSIAQARAKTSNHSNPDEDLMVMHLFIGVGAIGFLLGFVLWENHLQHRQRHQVIDQCEDAEEEDPMQNVSVKATIMGA